MPGKRRNGGARVSLPVIPTPVQQTSDKGVVEPDGRRMTKRIRHSGYKAHVSTDAKTGVITSFAVTTGNRADKERWLALEADPEYQGWRAQRYRVEQPFGTLKRWNGFWRCLYVGLQRYRTQALMTFVVHICKRMVNLLKGVTFRPEARGSRAEQINPILRGDVSGVVRLSGERARQERLFELQIASGRRLACQ